MHFIDKKNDLKHCGTTLQSLLSKSNYVFNSNEAFNRVVKTIEESKMLRENCDGIRI